MKTDKNNGETSVFDLFKTFFKIGIMTFGGAYAMLPMLEREIVNKHKWTTYDELLDYFAIGQMTPGIIAVNTATFIGYKKKGNIGAVFATLGIITPSLIIIIALASVLKSFQNNVYMVKAFSGIRITVCALILGALIKMAKKTIKGFPYFLLTLTALVSEIAFGLSPIIIAISTIALSIVAFFIKKKKENK